MDPGARVGAGVSLMVYISPQLALIMLSIVPPVAAGAVVYGRFVRTISKQTQDALSDATKVAEERYAWGKREGEGEGGWGVRLGCWAAGGVVRRRKLPARAAGTWPQAAGRTAFRPAKRQVGSGPRGEGRPARYRTGTPLSVERGQPRTDR